MSGSRNIIITGIAGRLGRLIAQRLHRDPRNHVIGIDTRAFDDRPKDIEHHRLDLRSKKTRDIFRTVKVDALVHLGMLHKPRASAAEAYSWNIGGTSKLLDYCATYKVPKVVVLSSSNVYGPRPENAQFLSEDAPLLAAQAFPAMRDLVEVDHMASSFFWKAREIETVILRPVHILGRVRNAPSNYLRLDPVPTLLGFDPMVQIIHELDVAEAVRCSVEGGVRGIFNVVGPGELPLSAVLSELERRTIPIPHPVAKPVWNLAWRLGLSSYPVAEFDFIRYVCMVNGSRAREAMGFAANHSLSETIAAVNL